MATESSIELEKKKFDIAWDLYHTTPYSLRQCLETVDKLGIDKTPEQYLLQMQYDHSNKKQFTRQLVYDIIITLDIKDLDL